MTGYTTKTARRYGYHVQPDQARQVWAALTAEPSRPLIAIAAELGLSRSCVSAARRLLRDAGYVDFDDRKQGTATRILVPFHVVRETACGARLEE